MSEAVIEAAAAGDVVDSDEQIVVAGYEIEGEEVLSCIHDSGHVVGMDFFAVEPDGYAVVATDGCGEPHGGGALDGAEEVSGRVVGRGDGIGVSILPIGFWGPKGLAIRALGIEVNFLFGKAGGIEGLGGDGSGYIPGGLLGEVGAVASDDLPLLDHSGRPFGSLGLLGGTAC